MASLTGLAPHRGRVLLDYRRSGTCHPDTENLMSHQSDSRRTFLAGAAGIAANTALAGGASAQFNMTMNDPNVVREIEAAFAGYDRALGANDVAALNGYFFDSPSTIRYGI